MGEYAFNAQRSARIVFPIDRTQIVHEIVLVVTI